MDETPQEKPEKPAGLMMYGCKGKRTLASSRSGCLTAPVFKEVFHHGLFALIY